MKRAARTLRPVGRNRRIASPDDLDLTVDLTGTLGTPPVVYNRDLHVEFLATAGTVTVARTPDGQVLPVWTFTATFSYQSVPEGKYTWIVQTLDRWWTDSETLRFVAAPRRISAFYAADGEMVPFPAVT